MNYDRRDEIKKLKTLLQKDGINILDAVDQFTGILNTRFLEFDLKEEDIVKKGISKLGISIWKETKKLDQRIMHLNRIMVLQELGVTFEEKELEILLQG